MSIELDRSGSAAAAFMLSVSTLLALKRNGTLADHELANIIEHRFGAAQGYGCGTSVRGGPLSISLNSSPLVSRAMRAENRMKRRDLLDQRDPRIAWEGSRTATATRV